MNQWFNDKNDHPTHSEVKNNGKPLEFVNEENFKKRAEQYNAPHGSQKYKSSL